MRINTAIVEPSLNARPERIQGYDGIPQKLLRADLDR